MIRTPLQQIQVKMPLSFQCSCKRAPWVSIRWIKINAICWEAQWGCHEVTDLGRNEGLLGTVNWLNCHLIEFPCLCKNILKRLGVWSRWRLTGSHHFGFIGETPAANQDRWLFLLSVSQSAHDSKSARFNLFGKIKNLSVGFSIENGSKS